ncbi:MAG: hypothetical protein AAF517_17840 [Planctomycetota bacterium]
MRTFLLSVCLILSVSSWSKADDEKLLEGELVQRVEQDLKEAERIYRSVIDAESTDEESKAKALVLLASCLDEQGRAAAAKQALQQAAAGNGPSAKKARSVLEGQSEAEQRLRSVVSVAVRNIERFGDINKIASRQLLTIGDPGVPYLAAYLEADKELSTQRVLARVLVEIGSTASVRFVEKAIAGKGLGHKNTIQPEIQTPKNWAVHLLVPGTL